MDGTKIIGVDLGANVECRAHHLLQFAQLGAAYAKNIMYVPKPRIGLLANGNEERKGTRLTKEAFWNVLGWTQYAVIDVNELSAGVVDDTVTGCVGPWVDPENSHPCLSSCPNPCI